MAVALSKTARPPATRTNKSDGWLTPRMASARPPTAAGPRGRERGAPGTDGRGPGIGRRTCKMFRQTRRAPGPRPRPAKERAPTGSSPAIETSFRARTPAVEPRLPAATALATTTANTRPICANDTPPSRATIMNSGSAASISATTASKLAESLPSTSSTFDSRVSSNRSSVCRSFSIATAPAADMAAKNSATANCKGARS